jgi:hypothetical protein
MDIYFQFIADVIELKQGDYDYDYDYDCIVLEQASMATASQTNSIN